ncbi:MAG: hypothetical protein JNK87_35150 [Bryobacterales bacterium]|nr:hypothetical protein [Bryobacterales bacterium]
MLEPLTLTGIDGSNPLGYLAALGTLRLLSQQHPAVRMHWTRDTAAWRPVLSGIDLASDALIAALLAAPAFPAIESAPLGKNITVEPAKFSEFVQKAEASLHPSGNRIPADFAAAFGSEVCVDKDKNRIEYTLLCFITGSGHQDFLETARTLLKKVEAPHLQETLFGPWLRRDDKLSLRWDPSDASEYALRWDNPGPLGVKSVWGAGRLAIEALPLFPTQPITPKYVATTGFCEDRYPEQFTWPLWTTPVSCDTVRSLVALAELRQAAPNRQQLTPLGIAEVFRSPRVRIGQGANFKVSFRPSKAV